MGGGGLGGELEPTAQPPGQGRLLPPAGSCTRNLECQGSMSGLVSGARSGRVSELARLSPWRAWPAGHPGAFRRLGAALRRLGAALRHSKKLGPVAWSSMNVDAGWRGGRKSWLGGALAAGLGGHVQERDRLIHPDLMGFQGACACHSCTGMQTIDSAGEPIGTAQLGGGQKVVQPRRLQEG